MKEASGHRRAKEGVDIFQGNKSMPISQVLKDVEQCFQESTVIRGRA